MSVPMPAPARTVLVIDDEDAIRTAVRLALLDEGYEVEEAADGRVALEAQCRASGPTVVLLNLMLPHLSGMRILQMAGREPRVTRHRYIVVTAARAFRAADLTQYLPPSHLLSVVSKPFDIDHLTAVVERAEHQLARESAAS